jgi:hypothetical protein
MDLSILKPTKSEIHGLIGFVICAAILMYIQRYFGGSFDMITALVVLISVAVFEIIYNISIDIDASN